MKGHPPQVKYEQNWGSEFILLLSKVAVLPGSDAGSDGVEPTSSFVNKNPQPPAIRGAQRRYDAHR